MERDEQPSLRERSLDDLLAQAGDYVRQNPGKAVLISLAVGVLIGRLLRRD
ncbi:MAG TPA: DUF883 C-terminal domain-containing protein [Candidatus Polarisedimenticolaceae bacterium]|nr:DUF883 C-terminal domain-containing protein [Candidatus Polarisedimenticolaceae bacterium]